MTSHLITIGNTELPVHLRKHAQARRIVLRYEPVQHALRVTLPRYASIKQGLHFVDTKRGWIERQLKEKIPRVPFADGAVLPLLGQECVLRHIGGRGVVHLEGNNILVPGDSAFMARRVREWIRKKTAEEIARLVWPKAARIDKKAGKISLRDTRSCWGSCAHNGNLSFSWRLAFAPLSVLDYLVSHEVAHLAQHNHSAAFWKIVGELCPAHREAKAWLKAHAGTLYGYG